VAKNEKVPLLTLLKNLPILLKVIVTASSRIPALTMRILENPHFDPAGFHVDRVQMILGLLYKVKKKRALALRHLTEARRILSQFGQTSMLARIDAALAELDNNASRTCNVGPGRRDTRLRPLDNGAGRGASSGKQCDARARNVSNRPSQREACLLPRYAPGCGA
jgi:hypothetical protein